MLEFSRNLSERIMGEVGDRWEEKFFSGLYKKYGEDALDNFPEGIFAEEKLKPIYIGDKENRTKLQTEGGVAFANHPNGAVDIGIIIEALKAEDGHVRDDFKVIVHPDSCPTLQKYLGKDHFVPAVDNATEARKIFGDAIKFINSGGLFLIFPENLEKMIAGKPMEFKAGISYLLEGVEDKRMAYTFFINGADLRNTRLKRLSRQGIKASMGVEAMIGHDVRMPRVGPELNVQVDEHYSKCGEWKTAMAGIAGNFFAKSQALKDHYLEAYKQVK